LKRIVQTIFVLAVLGVFVPQALAQERVFSEYEYDEVGNIISRTQDVSNAAPTIDAVTPSIVRQNQTLAITLTGQGLRGAWLGNENVFFTFSDVESSNEQLQFTLAVDKDADQGVAQISVSTQLGTGFFSLNVLNELPRFTAVPLTEK